MHGQQNIKTSLKYRIVATFVVDVETVSSVTRVGFTLCTVELGCKPRRSRIPFPMGSLGFFIDLILPVTL